jgi:sugar phosphate isomerase/epimerase
MLSRRRCLGSLAAAAGYLAGFNHSNPIRPGRSFADDPSSAEPLSAALVEALPDRKGAGIRYGLVTYQWGKDWDLPTLIGHCELAGVFGVELRTTHRHGVEPSLTRVERFEIRDRFEDSPVVCVGLGSNERFDHPSAAELQQAIETTKKFIVLSHDIGGTGVKVKPDRLHADIPRERTIEQIGRALNTLGEFAEGFGQQVRLEVHGDCAPLPIIAEILKVADHPAVGICWNSNPQDLDGEGLAANFALVQQRFGQTTHIHRAANAGYPLARLLELFVGIDYSGWLMLEEGTVPPQPELELIQERQAFFELLHAAQRKVG